MSPRNRKKTIHSAIAKTIIKIEAAFAMLSASLEFPDGHIALQKPGKTSAEAQFCRLAPLKSKKFILVALRHLSDRRLCRSSRGLFLPARNIQCRILSPTLQSASWFLRWLLHWEGPIA